MEYDGWRCERARYYPDLGLDEPMVRAGFERQIASLTQHGVRGFVRLARVLAEHLGSGVYDEVEALFVAEGVLPDDLRMGPAEAWQGWYWAD